MIGPFRGRYAFLSSFHPAVVRVDGVEYPSAEHGYQASKTVVEEERRRILEARSPGEARRRGKDVTLRPGWEEMKLDVMLDLVRQKFAHPDLRAALLRTGSEDLVEVNHWRDSFWGVCDGYGENHLGKILMRVRWEITEETLSGYKKWQGVAHGD